MKKYLIILIFTLSSIFNFSFASSKPTLFFSNMLSATNSGWSSSEPNKGVAVTVWGHGFAATRDSSYISVGDVQLTNDSSYAIWGENWPTPFWQRITFWLNADMLAGVNNITVTVNGQTSNPLEFTIRSGRIFFVSSNLSFGDGSIDNPYSYTQASGTSGYVNNMQPGDVFYYRSGTYDSRSNGGNSILWIRDSEPSGTANAPIALLAYPGETPTFYVATYDVNFRKGIDLDNDYMVFSGFQIDSEYIGADLNNYHRFIGNDVVGVKAKYGAGTGILNTIGNGNIILGNAFHGGNSKDRFDHATYFSGCAPDVGNHLGWNYVYDNDFGRGPELSVNHQQNRCAPDTEILKAHFIFNNIVDCGPQRAVAINVYDLSYDTGEPEPEPTYFYNNIILNCGTLDLSDTNNIGWVPTLIANSGHARFYNNVLYNSEYVGFQNSAATLSTEFRNNIIVMNSTSPLADDRDHLYINDDNPSNNNISNNLFYDIGNSVTSSAGIDTAVNIVNQAPQFVNPATINFALNPASPAINAGANDLLFEVPAPSYAPINRDIKFILRSGQFDIGAYESVIDLIYENGFE